MKNYTIADRLDILKANVEIQGFANWDDIEKLEHILCLLLDGKKMDDDFVWVENHYNIILDHIKETYDKYLVREK